MLSSSIISYLHLITIMALVCTEVIQCLLCNTNRLKLFGVEKFYKLNILAIVMLTALFTSGTLQTLWGKHGILEGVDFLQKNWILFLKVFIFCLYTFSKILVQLNISHWKTTESTISVINKIANLRKLHIVNLGVFILMPFLGICLSNGYGY